MKPADFDRPLIVPPVERFVSNPVPVEYQALTTHTERPKRRTLGVRLACGALAVASAAAAYGSYKAGWAQSTAESFDAGQRSESGIGSLYHTAVFGVKYLGMVVTTLFSMAAAYEAVSKEG